MISNFFIFKWINNCYSLSSTILPGKTFPVSNTHWDNLTKVSASNFCEHAHTQNISNTKTNMHIVLWFVRGNTVSTPPNGSIDSNGMCVYIIYKYIYLRLITCAIFVLKVANKELMQCRHSTIICINLLSPLRNLNSCAR